MFKKNDLKIYIRSIVNQGPQLSQTPYPLAWNARRALNTATAKFEKLYQNKAAELEEAYTTPDSRDWYQRDTTETEEILRDNMSQQAHESGNATPTDNEGSGTMSAQPSNDNSLNNQILMIQLPADNSWVQKVMFILQQML